MGAVALYLMVRRASEYLGCSRDELLAWVPNDRHMPGDCGPNSGARLWHRATLDATKPYISAWRERDRAISAAAAERARQADAEASARRAGMRKGKAVTAKRACERLGCSLTELNRWAADGRLPPDGTVMLAGTLPKTVEARAWLPGTLDQAASAVASWREQDETRKAFKRRGLKPCATAL